MKIIIKYIKVFFILQFIFILFATISCLIPNKTIKKNIEESLAKYANENVYPQHFIKLPAHQSDNFTDYLIMDLMYNVSPHKPFKYVLFPQGHFQAQTTSMANISLKYSVENQNIEPNFIYGRYWNGSSFAYRWLFSVASLSGVRWMIFFFCSIVLFAFVMKLNETIDKPSLYLLLIGLIFANYYLIFMSLQFTPVFLITMIGSICLINRIKNKRSIGLLFLILGSLTCFFDLLTVPALSLGIPLLIWLILQKNISEWFRNFKSIVSFSMSWFIGYVSTWMFKWLLIFTFTDYSILNEIKQQIQLRAGTWKGSRLDAIIANFEMLNSIPLLAIFIVLIILMMFYFNKKGLTKAILFISIAFIPIIWMFATANHVEMHSWFAYRSLWVSISALFLATGSFIRWNEISIPVLKKYKK